MGLRDRQDEGVRGLSRVGPGCGSQAGYGLGFSSDVAERGRSRTTGTLRCVPACDLEDLRACSCAEARLHRSRDHPELLHHRPHRPHRPRQVDPGRPDAAADRGRRRARRPGAVLDRMDIERERGVTIKSQAACRVEPEAMTTQNRACFSISSFLDHIYNTSHQLGVLQRPTEPTFRFRDAPSRQDGGRAHRCQLELLDLR